MDPILICKKHKDFLFNCGCYDPRVQPGIKYGCWVDGLDHVPHKDCVIDTGDRSSCLIAMSIIRKEDCEYWRVNDYKYKEQR